MSLALSVMYGSTVQTLSDPQGTVVLTNEDIDWGRSTITDDYRQHLRDGGDRYSYPGNGHADHLHSLPLRITGATRSAVFDNLAALMAVMRDGARLIFADSDIGTAHLAIIAVDFSEPVINALDHEIDIVAHVDCHPYWWPASSFSASLSASGIPAYGQLVVGGDWAALTAFGIAPEQASSAAALGVFPEEGGTTPIQDYTGTTDADATNGAASGALSASWATIGTPAELDAETRRGDWLIAARLKTTDTATHYRAKSITGTQEYISDVVDASVANDYETIFFGPVPIPAAGIPAADTPAGWGSVAARVSQATQDTYVAMNTYDATYRGAVESFVLANRTEISSVGLYVDAPDDFPTAALKVAICAYTGASGAPVGAELTSATFLASTFSATGVYELDLPPIDLVAGTYVLTVEPSTPGSAAGWWAYYKNSDAYASGTFWFQTQAGAYVIQASKDLYFVLYGRTRYGFTQSIAIQACNDGAASKTVRLDTVGPVPCKGGAALVAGTFAATEGAYLDNLSHKVRDCDVYGYSDDTATVLLSPAIAIENRTTYPGPPLLWPGTNGIVHTAAIGDVAPQGDEVRVEWREQYLDYLRAMGAEAPA